MMFERFTDRARKAMSLANQEAQRFNNDQIGDEHILLGLIRDDRSVALNVLQNLQIDPRKIRLEVEKLIKPGADLVTLGRLPKTPKATTALENAIKEARGFEHNYVGTEHLLLGVMLVEDGTGRAALISSGVKHVQQLRDEVKAFLGAGQSEEVESAREAAVAILRLAPSDVTVNSFSVNGKTYLYEASSDSYKRAF